MQLPFLSKFKKKTPKPSLNPNETHLAIDIGTEYLKSLLFSMDEVGIHIIKSSRIQQQQKAMNRGIINNLSTVLENCHLSIRELTNNLEPTKQPQDIVLGIAGEFIQGISIVVEYERDENSDAIVTKKEQKNIINTVHEQISQSGREDLARRTGLHSQDIKILHIVMTGLEIGGMPVETLVGFKGKKVKLFFYASFAPKTFTESLKSLVNSLNYNLLGIVSQPFAVARSFVNADSKNFSGIFVDIGGGTTDIAIVQKGNVVKTQIFAFGGRVFTKEIAKIMNMSYRHAEQRKIMYSENELDKSIQPKVKTICYETAEVWMKAFSSALELCKDIELFPSNIYLCGGGSLLPDIRSALLEYPWTQLLPFEVIPKIQPFLPSDLEAVIDEANNLNSVYDITPVALAKFAYDKTITPQNYYIPEY